MKTHPTGSFRSALAVFLLVLIVFYTQNADANSNVRIKIIVKADNGLDSIIRGYLARSVGELKGVTIDDVEPDYQIQCVAVEYSLEGYGPCCALSFVVLNNEDGLMLAASYAVSKKESLPEDLYTILPRQYGFVGQEVRMVPRENLRQACSEFIASLEGEGFEDNCKLIRNAHSLLNKRKHPKEDEGDPLGLGLENK
jgi:hypothetical protein